MITNSNMNCKKVSEMIIEYQQGELSLLEAECIKNHLESCFRCRDEAHVLKNGFDVMAKLPVCEISCNVEAVIEAALCQKKTWRINNWGIFVPLAACASLLIISAIFAFNYSPPSNISRNTAPHEHQYVSDNATIQQPDRLVPGKNNKPAQSTNSKQTANSLVNSDNARKLSATKTNKTLLHNQQLPSNMEQIPALTTVNISNAANDIDNSDNHEMVAQYVDTIVSCMISATQPRASITCAFSPITTADSADQTVADTLTAIIVTAFKDRYLHIEINRLLPSLAGVVSHPTLPENVAEATSSDKVNDQYLIVGSIATSKAGYLLSLYTIDNKNSTVIFNGDHPILLPADVIPQLSNS